MQPEDFDFDCKNKDSISFFDFNEQLLFIVGKYKPKKRKVQILFKITYDIKYINTCFLYIIKNHRAGDVNS